MPKECVSFGHGSDQTTSLWECQEAPLRALSGPLLARRDPPYRAETFTAKADAQAWLSRAEADITRGAWLDPAAGKVTVVELATRWLESNPMKRGSSKLRDESILDNHIVPVLGPEAVSRITRVDVQQLVDGWSQDHAPSTVVRMFAVVRGVFGFAVASDMIGRSPCTAVRVPRGSLVERPVLSAQQLQELASRTRPRSGRHDVAWCRRGPAVG